ncbi:hypothetical protein [Herbiconiux sp. VKM Ac-2851]|uniref:hypothetical protein n=1 Tax=Herbiconiux sp. VKM Ac-2851 TaxID=2739025 RepID=UPI00156607D1|nr:hypothetical protein [Herbiconiux sp. VKM Ac-2851]NQX36265.1 hypothetical protein [Herbiconiux sp. VKM Ac-2851]
MAPTKVATARELRARVAAKFGKRSEALSFPEHVTLFEVPFDGRIRPGYEGTGRRSRQRYDVLAVGLWPSSKHLVHGFELKVSRSDLLHELRDLTKSEHAAANVDRFWLVLGDRTILRDDDPIPASWGIIVPHGRGLTIHRDAQPQPGLMDRSLIRGITTRALVHPRIGTEVRYRDGLQKGRRDGVGYAQAHIRQDGHDHERLAGLAARL